MKITSSQQQLLSILNISVLQVHECFKPETQSVLSNSQTANTLAKPDMHSALAQDIQLVLGALSWQIDARLSDCQIQHDTLFTPDLNQLRHSAVKKQLWQLLASHPSEYNRHNNSLDVNLTDDQASV